MIYLDELLLVNFAAGAVFLLGAGLLCGQRCRGPRLLAGAVLAGISSLILLAPELPGLLALLYKVLVCAGCVAAAYGWPGARAFGQLCFWCVGLSLALTGAVALPGAQSRNLCVYLPVSPGRLLACTGGVYLLLRGLLFCLGRGTPAAPAFDAVLELNGAEVPVRAFCDTGFSVQDPLSGRAVVLVRYAAVRSALPQALRTYLDGQLAGDAAPPAPELGVRLVPCTTVAGRCLLPAVPLRALHCRRGGRCHTQRELLAAFCAAEALPNGCGVLISADTAAKLCV